MDSTRGLNTPPSPFVHQDMHGDCILGDDDMKHPLEVNTCCSYPSFWNELEYFEIRECWGASGAIYSPATQKPTWHVHQTMEKDTFAGSNISYSSVWRSSRTPIVPAHASIKHTISMATINRIRYFLFCEQSVAYASAGCGAIVLMHCVIRLIARTFWSHSKSHNGNINYNTTHV